MLIGIDFDNTIAGYDHVFSEVAVAEGLMKANEATTKYEVRELLRSRGGEKDWMKLQGRVYGAHIEKAILIDGVDEFLKRCHAKGVPVTIISHKTEFGHFDPDQINLHDVTRAWMRKRQFFSESGYGLSEDKVIFKPTREEKVEQIANSGCTHFIDDLEEVFAMPVFPSSIKQFLFSAHAAKQPKMEAKRYGTWKEITDAIFGA